MMIGSMLERWMRKVWPVDKESSVDGLVINTRVVSSMICSKALVRKIKECWLSDGVLGAGVY